MSQPRFLTQNALIMSRGGIALGQLSQLRSEDSHRHVSRHVSALQRGHSNPPRFVTSKLPLHFFVPLLEIHAIHRNQNSGIKPYIHAALVTFDPHALHGEPIINHYRYLNFQGLVSPQNISCILAPLPNALSDLVLRRTLLPGSNHNACSNIAVRRSICRRRHAGVRPNWRAFRSFFHRDVPASGFSVSLWTNRHPRVDLLWLLRRARMFVRRGNNRRILHDVPIKARPPARPPIRTGIILCIRPRTHLAVKDVLPRLQNNAHMPTPNDQISLLRILDALKVPVAGIKVKRAGVGIVVARSRVNLMHQMRAVLRVGDSLVVSSDAGDASPFRSIEQPP